MSVFREIEIEWDGETYTVVPSMRLLRSIEGEGISLMHVTNQVAQGKPQASLMATIMAKVMQSAGAKVTDDALYGEFMSSDPTAVMRLYESVIVALSPVEPDQKKPVAPDE